MSVHKLVRIGMVLALMVSINTLGIAQSKVLKQTANTQTEETTNPSIDPVDHVDQSVNKKNKKSKKEKSKKEKTKGKGAKGKTKKGKAKKYEKGDHPGKGHAYGKYKKSKEHKKAKSKTKRFTKEDMSERKVGSTNSKSRKIEKGENQTVRKSRKSIPPVKEN